MTIIRESWGILWKQMRLNPVELETEYCKKQSEDIESNYIFKLFLFHAIVTWRTLSLKEPELS